VHTLASLRIAVLAAVLTTSAGVGFPSTSSASTVGYVGGDVGLYYTMVENFELVYDSSIGLVLGVTGGFYLTDEISLFGRYRRFAKSGTPVTIEYRSRTTYNTSWEQNWIVGGVRYDIPLGVENLIPWIEAGAGYFFVTESMDAYGVSVSVSDDAIGLAVGGGLGYEVAPAVCLAVSGEFYFAQIQSEGGLAGEAGEDVSVGGFAITGGVLFRF